MSYAPGYAREADRPARTSRALNRAKCGQSGNAALLSVGLQSAKRIRKPQVYLISTMRVRAARSIARRRAPQASHESLQKVEAGGFGPERVPLPTSV